jgi:ABC-type branched-subunit amino acid transport system ATPase component/ABC-type branched-subunit amino acid transport system permease subunit
VSTVAALAGAARQSRRAWTTRATIAAAAFGFASLAPLLFGAARLADFAGGLYLAVAAIALAFVVGVAGLPSLAQGAFVATGAVTAARLLHAGAPTLVAALGGAVAGAAAGWVTGALFARLPPAGIAAATWIVSWLVSFALQSVSWFLGGTRGLVVTGGPTPAEHYELALALTALTGLAYVALARAPLGLQLAAARDREPAAVALRLPVARARVTAFALSGCVAGLAGALGVQLAGIGDPAQYGPYLSFKLFVVVLVGGALAPFGAAAGVVLLGALSVAADALGSLEHVASARSHTLLAAVMLLGIISLGWEGIVRPARKRFDGDPGPVPPVATGRLRAHALGKRYGDVVAADDVSLELAPGTVTALVGPNGSGKTTVLRMLAGSVAPDIGRVEDDGVARTLQATAVFASLTVLEHLLAAASPRRRRGGVLRSLVATPQARAEEAAFVADARALAARFALDPDAAVTALPTGDQRVVMLLAAAATGAPVLLVDEPTAGASHSEADRIAAVIAALRDDGRALLVVEHNLGVVRRVAGRVVALEAGRVVEDAAT